MDELVKSIWDLQKEENRDIAHWISLKKAMDSVYRELAGHEIETIFEKHNDIVKIIVDITVLVTKYGWRSKQLRSHDPELNDDNIVTIMISYLRLIRMMHRDPPTTEVERCATDWIQRLLTVLINKGSAVEDHGDILALAMVSADLVPDEWLKNVANPKFQTGMEIFQSSYESHILSMPSIELRKLLIWACCMAKIKDHQEDISILMDSVEQAKMVLPEECLLIYSHLNRMASTQ